jgi:hypothetical protein
MLYRRRNGLTWTDAVGSRRFPPPFVYSRDSDAEARQAKVLTKDEARRIAVNIARRPELLHRENDD